MDVWNPNDRRRSRWRDDIADARQPGISILIGMVFALCVIALVLGFLAGRKAVDCPAGSAKSAPAAIANLKSWNIQ